MLLATSPEITPPVVAAVAGAALLIGLSKGGLGGGLGPLITIVVATALPTGAAIGVLLPLLMVGDIIALWALRGHWDRPSIRALLPAAALGVVGASLFLRSVPERGLQLFLAIFSLAFVAYRLVEPRLTSRRLQPGTPLGVAAGFTSGITSTVAHAGGPPVAIYLLASQITPLSYVSTTAAFFFVVNWLKVPGYAAAGLFDRELMMPLIPLAVLIWPGVYAGRWVVRRIGAGPFERLVLGLLLVGAVYLIVDP